MTFIISKNTSGNLPPVAPNIEGRNHGKVDTSYYYEFSTTDPEDQDIYFFVDWGDNTSTGWIGPYNSGEITLRQHAWTSQGMYTIKCKAKDPYEAEGPWGYFEVNMPRNKAINSPILNFLQSHPNMFPLLQMLLQRLGLQ